MGLFGKKKDKRVQEISDWAQSYLVDSEPAKAEPEPESAAVAVEALPDRQEEAPAAQEDAAPETVVPAPAEAEEASEPEPPAEAVPWEEDLLPASEEEIGEVEEVAVVAERLEQAPPEKPSLFERLRSGLARTREGLVGKIDRLFALGKKIDDETLEKLEEILIEADLGVQQSLSLIESIQRNVKRGKFKNPRRIRQFIRDELLNVLNRKDHALNRPEEDPYVVMVVGVNGVGKTTSIAKLAWRFVQAGDEVLLAAGDTFRAAATEQLEIWGERVGAKVVKHKSGADPSAVVFDALKAAQSRGANVVIADTAGRLHTKVNLMEELKKMKRVMDKVVPGAPHEILLVLDATTGQNALSQAKTFLEAIGVTGIVLTKLDGTAKGGIVTAIMAELGLPVKLIGIGESMEDLRDFDPEEYVRAIFDGS